MSKKIRVLVDGVGGDVGQGILKSLLNTKLNIELYASCISDKSSWLYKIKNSYIFPLVSDDNFIDFLVDFINKYKIDVYFPTVDSTLLKISKNKEFIESKTNVKIFIDNLEKIEICDDKYLTNKFLVKNSFYAPKTVSMDDLNLNEVYVKRLEYELKSSDVRWDKEKKQVINCPEANDYNLIIGSIKSKINAIQVKFRLSEKPLTMEAFIDNLKGSTNTVEFIKFFEHYSKNLDISHSTLKKHKSIFEKLNHFF